MKLIAVTLFLLESCAHQAVVPAPYHPPGEAPNTVELLRSIPADLFRGDIDRAPRAAGSADELTFVFLKNEVADQVPMRVAVYSHSKDQPLRLQLLTALPFTEGECRRGECRARIAELPDGFQISRESYGADHMKEDYRFVWRNGDLELAGLGEQAHTPDGGACSVYRDYVKRRVVHRRGSDTRVETMPEAPAPRLGRDRLKFEAALPQAICALKLAP